MSLTQGVFSPVAPPGTVSKSDGSRRGQSFTSSWKHKLGNLGEQRIGACIEDGDETEVLFQAGVSKPLVSLRDSNTAIGLSLENLVDSWSTSVLVVDFRLFARMGEKGNTTQN